MNKRKNKKSQKILIVVAMKSELDFLLKTLKARKIEKLFDIFQLYKSTYASKEIYIIETYVGETNASIATLAAILKVNPFLIIKFGAVGGSFQSCKAGDIILPLGYFHRNAWITRDEKTQLPTPDSSKWDSVYGEHDYQIQASRNNLGGIPYYFSVKSDLLKYCKNVLNSLKARYLEAYVGGGDMWMFDQQLLDNVITKMLPHNAKTRHFVSDMESYSVANACYITKKPFIGCYLVASNDYNDEKYFPEKVAAQMNKLTPYILSLIKEFKLYG